MYLTRLIYVSRRVPEVPVDVGRLLESARRRNVANHITGALWSDGDHFIQVLEGGRRAVSETYHLITADPRHTDIELVSCVQVPERVFPAWSMGFCSDTQSNRERILRFSGHDHLVPREMSGDSLLGLLRSFELR